MQRYIYEGSPRRAGPMRAIVLPGAVMAAETVATLLVTVLAVGVMLFATEGVAPVTRFLLLLGAFALAGLLTGLIGNVPLPEPIGKWADPWPGGGG
jgi:hypothetical protein